MQGKVDWVVPAAGLRFHQWTGFLNRELFLFLFCFVFLFVFVFSSHFHHFLLLLLLNNDFVRKVMMKKEYTTRTSCGCRERYTGWTVNRLSVDKKPITVRTGERKRETGDPLNWRRTAVSRAGLLFLFRGLVKKKIGGVYFKPKWRRWTVTFTLKKKQQKRFDAVSRCTVTHFA